MALALNAKVQNVRQQVLASHPDLKADEDTLLAQLEDLKHPAPGISLEDRLSLHQKWVAHEGQVRDEAIKIDPTVAPYF